MTPSSPFHIQRSNSKSAPSTHSINVHELRCMLVREGDHVTQTNQSPSQGGNCQAPTQGLPVHVLWSPLQDLAPSRAVVEAVDGIERQGSHVPEN